MLYETVKAKQMSDVARELVKMLKPGRVVLLHGEVGAGKTTLVRLVLRRLGWKGKVTSPTFTIACNYEIKKTTVHHLDLYRLSEQQAESGFLEDYFAETAVTFVEWPEKLPAGLLELPHLDVSITRTMAGRARRIEVSGEC